MATGAAWAEQQEIEKIMERAKNSYRKKQTNS
jgi:hypothetical protein